MLGTSWNGKGTSVSCFAALTTSGGDNVILKSGMTLKSGELDVIGRLVGSPWLSGEWQDMSMHIALSPKHDGSICSTCACWSCCCCR